MRTPRECIRSCYAERFSCEERQGGKRSSSRIGTAFVRERPRTTHIVLAVVGVTVVIRRMSGRLDFVLRLLSREKTPH